MEGLEVVGRQVRILTGENLNLTGVCLRVNSTRERYLIQFSAGRTAFYNLEDFEIL